MGNVQGVPSSGADGGSSPSPGQAAAAGAGGAPPPQNMMAGQPCAAGFGSDDGECPVPEEYRGRHGIFDVYNRRIDGSSSSAPASSSSSSASSDTGSQRKGWFGGWFRGGDKSSSPGERKGYGDVVIDPRNNMPTTARQHMAPGQRNVIPTERQKSTIPKSGTGGATWVYPSPQMFYNSLVRKGKADDCTEDDMASVVSVHNSMNEDTWRRVLTWERLHKDECRNPMLLRFRGRPDDLSPLACARWLLSGGKDKPFDRHDWWIDRDGRQIRYVIDYYFHEDKAGTPGQFDLVVRPAADSVGSVMDRLKMQVYVGCAVVGIPCPITGNNSELGSEARAPNTTD